MARCRMALALLVISVGQSCVEACGSGNLTFIQPADGDDITNSFDLVYELGAPLAPGSLHMIFSSPDDEYSPHDISFSPAMESVGHHSIELDRFSAAQAEQSEITTLHSGVDGRGHDLVRGAMYNVTLTAVFSSCNHTVNVEHSVRRFDMLWVFGVLASLVSSAGSTFGMLIQKCAITSNERKIKLQGKGAPVVCGFTCSLAWFIGFFFMVIVPLPFDIISLALCGQSLQAPLGGVSVLMNQIIAPCLLQGESMSRLDWFATFLILIGVAVATAFGTHSSVQFSLDELLSLFEAPVYIVCTVILWCFGIFPAFMIVGFRSTPRELTGREKLGDTVVVCASDPPAGSGQSSWATASITALLEDGSTNCKAKSGDQVWTLLPRSRIRLPSWPHIPLAYAFLAGAVGSQTNVLLKATAELIEGLVGGKTDDWARPHPYFYVIVTFSMAAVQLGTLNKGLAISDTTKYLPVYNALLILFATFYGALYYQEYKDWSTAGWFFFPIGCAIVMVGVLVLTLGGKQEQATAIAPDSSATNATNNSKVSTDEMEGLTSAAAPADAKSGNVELDNKTKHVSPTLSPVGKPDNCSDNGSVSQHSESIVNNRPGSSLPPLQNVARIPQVGGTVAPPLTTAAA